MTHDTAPDHIRFAINGLSCGGCAARAEKALTSVAGISDISVNLATHEARFAASDPSDITAALTALDRAGYPARIIQDEFDIANLSCGGCVARAERAISQITGVTEVHVNLATHSAQISYVDGLTSVDDIQTHSQEAGYTATPRQTGALGASDTDPEAAQRKSLKQALIWAALLTVPVFVLEMGGHMFSAFHQWVHAHIGQQKSWLVQWALTTAVLVGPGRVFYRTGIPALIKGAPDMNSLVALGTGAAYAYSCVATFWPSALPDAVRAVYFEAAAVIVVLILLGRLLEARAKGRTGAAIKNLMNLRPQMASAHRNGAFVDVPIDALRVGDVIQIRPGEAVAADGVILKGQSHINEAMLTGEPIAPLKSKGEPVTGGTLNGAGHLEVRVTAVGAQTTLAQIITLVQQAQGARLPIQTLVNKITLWFVPAVLALATLTLGVWLIFGGLELLNLGIVAAVSVLIIACPCAMGLATPTSIMVGTGRAAELGVLFRKGDALQSLSHVDIIAFDKTGTLTQGQPSVTEYATTKGQDDTSVLRRIAGVESASEHPLAKAIVKAAQDRGIDIPTADAFEATIGDGATARVEGHDMRIGTARFLTDHAIALDPALETQSQGWATLGHSVVHVACDGVHVAALALSDPIKDTTRAALDALRAQGKDIVMITGDTQAAAETIAAQLGISDVIAHVRPDGKHAAIETLRQRGAVAFVGDGINDAPALAAADVGIALGTGTDVAIQSADVVLMSGDLTAVARALDVSTRTLVNIRQNLVWAFGYNVALVPVAAGALYPAYGVLLSPILAAGAMALSSVFVVTNALRLRFIGGGS